jgi:hypothetical protein
MPNDLKFTIVARSEAKRAGTFYSALLDALASLPMAKALRIDIPPGKSAAGIRSYLWKAAKSRGLKIATSVDRDKKAFYIWTTQPPKVE